MSRPVDWTPLADGDPVPGDPYEVSGMGRRYSNIAQAILDAAEKLTRLASRTDEQVSDAVDALRANCEQVASDIRRAHDRYAGVGEALSAYGPLLDDAQQVSLRALDLAQEAHVAAQHAQQRVDAASSPEEHSAATRAVSEAEDRLSAARRLLDQAIEDRDRAARTAIDLIRDVQDSGDLNDGWWDNWGHKVVEIVQKAAEVVATVCAIAALVVGWIPVVGQALAAVLGTVALIATAVSLVMNILLASTDYGDWGEVAWDAVGLASFGIGRAAGFMAKGASRAFRGLSRLKAGSIAAQGGGNLTVHGLMGGDALAGASRNVARGLFGSGVRTGRICSENVVASLRTLPQEFSDAISTLRSTTKAQFHQALRQGIYNLSHGSLGQRLKALYGETDFLAHDRFASQLSSTLLTNESLTKAAHAYQRRALTVLSLETFDHFNDLKGAAHLTHDLISRLHPGRPVHDTTDAVAGR